LHWPSPAGIKLASGVPRAEDDLAWPPKPVTAYQSCGLHRALAQVLVVAGGASEVREQLSSTSENRKSLGPALLSPKGYRNVHPCQAANMGDERGMAKSGLASSIGTPVDLIGNILSHIHHPTCQDGVHNGGASLCEIRHMGAWRYVGVHKSWPESGQG